MFSPSQDWTGESFASRDHQGSESGCPSRTPLSSGRMRTDPLDLRDGLHLFGVPSLSLSFSLRQEGRRWFRPSLPPRQEGRWERIISSLSLLPRQERRGRWFPPSLNPTARRGGVHLLPTTVGKYLLAGSSATRIRPPHGVLQFSHSVQIF